MSSLRESLSQAAKELEERVAATEAALLNTQDQLRAMRERAEKAEARARLFKEWNYAALYGASPGTVVKVFGRAAREVSADFVLAELRALGMLTGTSLRRFLWEA